MLYKVHKLKLWHKVIIGMILGIVSGFLLGEYACYAKPFATIFTNLVKMCVVPLVFFAVLYGVTSIEDIGTLGRLGLKAFAVYSLTTVLAVSIGLVCANIFQPGIGFKIVLGEQTTPLPQATKSIVQMLLDIIPTNPIQAMATGNTLQVVVFAMIIGLALILVGERGRVMKEFITSATMVVFKMMDMIISLTPYGVFAIMIWIVGEYGISMMISLSGLVLVILGAFVLQYLVFALLIIVLAGLNPLHFLRKITNVQALALATSSSKATLATSIQDLRQKLGVSERVSSFVLPLGASMNMDGTSIYLCICAVFVAQVTGIHLSVGQYGIIMLAATIGSIGAAGFPGGGVVMLGMVLSSVHLPLEWIGLMLGIDRFIDMFRTMINITGDCTVTLVIDKMEKTLNEAVYNSSDNISTSI